MHLRGEKSVRLSSRSVLCARNLLESADYIDRNWREARASSQGQQVSGCKSGRLIDHLEQSDCGDKRFPFFFLYMHIEIALGATLIFLRKCPLNCTVAHGPDYNPACPACTYAVMHIIKHHIGRCRTHSQRKGVLPPSSRPHFLNSQQLSFPPPAGFISTSYIGNPLCRSFKQKSVEGMNNHIEALKEFGGWYFQNCVFGAHSHKVSEMPPEIKKPNLRRELGP